MASSGRLEPGEKGKISVHVDIKGKSGNIQKSIQVHTNDPAKPVTALSVTMQVKDRTHSDRHSAKEIFNGQCRGCHVERGRGRKLSEVFRENCLICHGPGKSASPVSQMSRRPREYLLNAIISGVEGTSMPGWAVENDGPLGGTEIESLVDVIRNEEESRSR